MQASTLAAGARLAALAGAHHGTFTRAQALGCGYSASAVDRRVRAGEWVRVLPAVYRHGAAPPTRAAAHWAAVLWAGEPCALSHLSAATLWGLPVPRPDRPQLSVPATRGVRTAAVAVHRVAALDARDLVRLHGLPVTAPLRTCTDLAAVLDASALEEAVRGACARGVVTVRALERALAAPGARRRAGAARLRAVLRAIGPVAGAPSDRMAG